MKIDQSRDSQSFDFSPQTATIFSQSFRARHSDCGVGDAAGQKLALSEVGEMAANRYHVFHGVESFDRLLLKTYSLGKISLQREAPAQTRLAVRAKNTDVMPLRQRLQPPGVLYHLIHGAAVTEYIASDISKRDRSRVRMAQLVRGLQRLAAEPKRSFDIAQAK